MLALANVTPQGKQADQHPAAGSEFDRAIVLAQHYLQEQDQSGSPGKARSRELQRQERRLVQKEENLDRKMDAMEKKEEGLAAREDELETESDEEEDDSETEDDKGIIRKSA